MLPPDLSKLTRVLGILVLLLTLRPVGQAQTSCGLASPDWANTYSHQQKYMIGAPLNPTSTAIKTVKVTVHVFRHALGDAAPIPFLSFADTPQGRQELTDLVEQYTLPFFAAIEPPSTPMAGYSYPNTDANIRFDVVDVRFIYNTAVYTTSYQYTNGPALMTAALAEDLDSEETLHVFICRAWGDSLFPNMSPFASYPALGTFQGQVFAAILPRAYLKNS